MDLYEPLGNQQDVVDPPPATVPKKKPAQPPPPPLAVTPLKKRNPHGSVDAVKPLRDGDDIDLDSDSAPGPIRRKEAVNEKKKPLKPPPKPKVPPKPKPTRKSGGKGGSSGSKASTSRKSEGGLVVWQIIVLCVLGLMSVIFISMAVFGGLHLFGVIHIVPHLTPLKCQ